MFSIFILNYVGNTRAFSTFIFSNYSFPDKQLNDNRYSIQVRYIYLVINRYQCVGKI